MVEPDSSCVVTVRNSADHWIVEVEILNRESRQGEYVIYVELDSQASSDRLNVRPMERSTFSRSFRKSDIRAGTLNVTVRRSGDLNETHVRYRLEP